MVVFIGGMGLDWENSLPPEVAEVASDVFVFLDVSEVIFAPNMLTRSHKIHDQSQPAPFQGSPIITSCLLEKALLSLYFSAGSG